QRLRFVDTRRIRDYLAVAAELEPALECHDGRRLTEVLRAEEQQFVSLIGAWRPAAQAASEHMRDSRLPSSQTLDPDHPDVRALAMLRTHDAAEAARLLEPVLDRAAALFSFEDADLKKRRFTEQLVS